MCFAADGVVDFLRLVHFVLCCAVVSAPFLEFLLKCLWVVHAVSDRSISRLCESRFVVCLHSGDMVQRLIDGVMFAFLVFPVCLFLVAAPLVSRVCWGVFLPVVAVSVVSSVVVLVAHVVVFPGVLSVSAVCQVGASVVPWGHDPSVAVHLLGSAVGSSLGVAAGFLFCLLCMAMALVLWVPASLILCSLACFVMVSFPAIASASAFLALVFVVVGAVFQRW